MDVPEFDQQYAPPGYGMLDPTGAGYWFNVVEDDSTVSGVLWFDSTSKKADVSWVQQTDQAFELRKHFVQCATLGYRVEDAFMMATALGAEYLEGPHFGPMSDVEDILQEL